MHTIEAEHLTKDYGSGRGVFALVAAMFMAEPPCPYRVG